jgi:plasmid stabilization system protein ParE
MTRYRVVFSNEAINDLAASYQWGVEAWGEEAAWYWYTDLKDAVRKLLAAFPESQPIAPDNHEFDVEVRQMLVGRYRILFTFSEKVVTVFQIRGPYTD